MKNFILGSVITLLFSVCVFLYVKNISLSASLNTYRSNKEIINKELQKVKEDYYIQQQSDSLTLILFTVTTLFGLFSFFTFTSVKRMFDVNISEIKDKYNEQVTKYEESVIHINNLRSAFNLQYAEKISDKFGEALLERPLDIPNLVELGLMSCQNYYYSVGYNSNNKEEFSKVVTKYITPIINVMVEKVNSVDSIELKNISYAHFLMIKESFDLMSNKDNLQKFSTIFSKLSFKKLD